MIWSCLFSLSRCLYVNDWQTGRDHWCRILTVKSEHHLLEELLLGDRSWHFDSIMWHISKFGFLHKQISEQKQHDAKKHTIWKITSQGMLYRLESIAGSYESLLWLPKIKTFMRFVWSLISYLKIGHFFIARWSFIQANGVVASSFPSPSILYFFSIMLSDVIHSRWVHREHILSKLVTAVVYNYFFLGILIFPSVNHLIASIYLISRAICENRSTAHSVVIESLLDLKIYNFSLVICLFIFAS